MGRRNCALASATLLCLATQGTSTVPTPSTWRGLRVEPERRCSEYEYSHYRAPRTSEQRIQEDAGSAGSGWYAPYEARLLLSAESEVEHVVAALEAHESGACAWTRSERRAFARDLANLTLATPELNGEKGARDAGEWLPPHGRCGFARRVVFVKRRWKLSIDERERVELELVLATCEAGRVPARTAGRTALRR